MSKPRMPHGNRVSGSSVLKTNDIWQKTIGYDPYSSSSANAVAATSSIEERIKEEHTASVLLLAKVSNLSGTESRGGCKKCGMLGHLTFQCRNQQTAVKPKANSDDDSDDDSDDEDVKQKVSVKDSHIESTDNNSHAQDKKRKMSGTNDDDDGDESSKEHKRHKKHSSSSSSHSKHKKEKKEKSSSKKHKHKKEESRHHKKSHKKDRSSSS